MKKMICLLLFMICGVYLTGCYMHYQDIEVMDVKVYDSEGVEIKGVFRNGFGGIIEDAKSKLSTKPLNSAAPVVKYLQVDVKEHANISIVFQLKNKIANIIDATFWLSNRFASQEAITTSDIQIKDKSTYVTIHIEAVEIDKNTYEISQCTTETGSYHFSVRGSNTYIRGVYFHFPSQVNNSSYF